MSFIPTIPDPEKIKQTLAKAHRSCQEMELAGIQLEEVIAKLDSHSVRVASASAERLRQREILTQRKQRLGKALEQEQC
jgi:multidrug resistance efflux pump